MVESGRTSAKFGSIYRGVAADMWPRRSHRTLSGPTAHGMGSPQPMAHPQRTGPSQPAGSPQPVGSPQPAGGRQSAWGPSRSPQPKEPMGSTNSPGQRGAAATWVSPQPKGPIPKEPSQPRRCLVSCTSTKNIKQRSSTGPPSGARHTRTPHTGAPTSPIGVHGRYLDHFRAESHETQNNDLRASWRRCPERGQSFGASGGVWGEEDHLTHGAR